MMAFCAPFVRKKMEKYVCSKPIFAPRHRWQFNRRLNVKTFPFPVESHCPQALVVHAVDSFRMRLRGVGWEYRNGGGQTGAATQERPRG